MVELYSPDDHLEMIQGWAKERGLPVVPGEYYPSTGAVVPGVYACFLYLTGTPVAFLEELISNPNTTKEQRAEAMIACDEFLTEIAASVGVRLIMGKSANKSVLNIGTKYGWDLGDNYTTMWKRIKQ